MIDHSTQNPYRGLWEAYEADQDIPTRFRNLQILPYEELTYRVMNSIAYPIIDNLWKGDAYLIKGAFTKEFMYQLIIDVHNYCMTRPSEFHQMLEDSPDFHREIDLETGKKYSISSCKHSCYFYHWNEDPFEIFEPINQVWHTLKVLMGLQYNEYENNTPKNGVVDRIQVVRYPPRIGYLEPHVDAYNHQRLIFSGYMSKRGVDYQGGGFYLINNKDEVVNIEDQIDVGDILFCYASVYHGVAPCECSCVRQPDGSHHEKCIDWKGRDGRWFLSMYSNASDELIDHNGIVLPPRVTASPVKLDIPEVLPNEI